MTTPVFDRPEQNSSFIALFIGKPRSGKTYAMKSLLYSQTIVQQNFKFGRVFSTSGLYNDDWKDALPRQALQAWDSKYFEKYVTWMKDVRAKRGEIAPNFIIFDDLLGTKDFLNNPFVNSFFAAHRHTNTSVFISAQYIGKGTSTLLREICNYAFIWKSGSAASRDYLFESFGVNVPINSDEKSASQRKKFLHLLDDATSEPHCCLLYDASKDDSDSYSSWKANEHQPFQLRFKI